MNDRPVGVALAACGLSGRIFHAPFLRAHPGYRLVGAQAREGGTPPLPGLRIYPSFEALLAEPEVELVVVNTPDATHAEFAAKALESGRHVVVEKPFTPTLAEAEALVALARRSCRVLAVFHNRRWDADFLTLRQVLSQGRVGRPVEFIARWDRYRPLVRPSWREARPEDGGLLGNLGSHLIDQAMVLFGAPEALTARLARLREGARAEDWFDLALHYPNLQVRLSASYLAQGDGPRYALHGTEASYLKHGVDPQEAALQAGQLPGSPGWGEEDPAQWGLLSGPGVPDPVPSLPGNYGAFYEGLHAAIRHGAAVPVSAEEGLAVVRVLEAARRSHREGRTLSWEAVAGGLDTDTRRHS